MFIGNMQLILNGDEIPLYIANFVLMEYGTGIIMSVPVMTRDFELQKCMIFR